MKMSGGLFAATIVSATLAGAVAWAQAPKLKWMWDDKLDAVIAAPKIHKVLFENDHVRLLEVTIHAGEKEPMHGHRYPSVFALDAPQPALDNEELDGKMSHATRSPIDADFPICHTMGVQAPHSVKITDTFQQHFYRLEFKKIDGKDIIDKP
jgi:hypothetical protein